jgi:ribosomal protein S20
MLADDEIQLMEQMQLAGFSQDQVGKVISLKITLRESSKKWTANELEELDTMLKTRWKEMVKALSKDDIDKASTYFDKDMREIHKMLLSASTPEQRAPVLKTMEDIKFIGVKGANCAEYKIKMPLTRINSHSSELVFIKNDEGIWEIKSF